MSSQSVPSGTQQIVVAPGSQRIVVDKKTQKIIVQPGSTKQSVAIVNAGPPGPKGPPGPQGVPGEASRFYFQQVAPSDTWTITHNLNKKPSVVVVDTSDNVVEPDVQYLNLNTVVVKFSSPYAGSAYLN